MIKILPLLFGIIFTAELYAQNFTGQWKGYFVDKSNSYMGWGGDRCEYVLELECNGKNVSGYSYTYYNEGNKRYYTICKLSGTIINKSKSIIEVKEIKRIKTNVPTNVHNCFQVHRLTYIKQHGEQTLEGSWKPVSEEDAGCGYGSTVLVRRELQENAAVPKISGTEKNKPSVTFKNKPSAPVSRGSSKINPSLVIKQNHKTTAKVEKNKPKEVPSSEDEEEPATASFQGIQSSTMGRGYPNITQNKILEKNNKAFEKRSSNLLKTIEVDHKTLKVDLYDNGHIDGDSISLFFNGKLILSNKRLSDKAISLTLSMDEEVDINELSMYANNLGTIPPNTALMVVTDGDKRYEVRISSDLQRSGTIRFIQK